MAIYMSVPRGPRVGTNKYAARNDLIHADREWSTASSRDKSVHCKTAFIHGQRLANASSYLTYTLVHKHVDILIVIKFYIREIYINRSLDISYNLIEIVV